MFISDASANAPTVSSAPAPATSSGTSATPLPDVAPQPAPLQGMVILLLIPLLFYFISIRPSQRKIKEFNEMVKSLKRGDRIVTGGGVIGTISKIENDEVLVVEIAPDVKIRVMRETISNVVNKTAVNDNKADSKAAKKQDDKVNV